MKVARASNGELRGIQGEIDRNSTQAAGKKDKSTRNAPDALRILM
jgi:hypothetical protein